MTLSDYLAEREMKDGEFAPLVGCDRSTIYRIRHGQRPSPDLMLKIVEVTDGLVRPDDFYGLAA